MWKKIIGSLWRPGCYIRKMEIAKCEDAVHRIIGYLYHNYNIKPKTKYDFIIKYNNEPIYDQDYYQKYEWYFQGKIRKMYIISKKQQTLIFGNLTKEYHNNGNIREKLKIYLLLNVKIY